MILKQFTEPYFVHAHKMNDLIANRPMRVAHSLRELFEEACCIGDLGLGLEMVGVKRFAKGFGIGNRVCDLAVIQVWGKGDETSFGQSRANGLYGVVQPHHAWSTSTPGPSPRSGMAR
jgi:hypothetical protein